MIPIKPHAYAELPDEFHTCQMWQGFKNPLLVTQNVELKKELGFQSLPQIWTEPSLSEP